MNAFSDLFTLRFVRGDSSGTFAAVIATPATTRDWVWPPWWRVLIDLAVVILVVAAWIWWRRRRRTRFPSTPED